MGTAGTVGTVGTVGTGRRGRSLGPAAPRGHGPVTGSRGGPRPAGDRTNEIPLQRRVPTASGGARGAQESPEPGPLVPAGAERSGGAGMRSGGPGMLRWGGGGGPGRRGHGEAPVTWRRFRYRRSQLSRGAPGTAMCLLWFLFFFLVIKINSLLPSRGRSVPGRCAGTRFLFPSRFAARREPPLRGGVTAWPRSPPCPCPCPRGLSPAGERGRERRWKGPSVPGAGHGGGGARSIPRPCPPPSLSHVCFPRL